MKTLFLTGARGLVGDAVLRHFHAAGWRVVAGCSGQVRPNAENVEAIPFDLSAVAGEKIEGALASADAVVHCAAILPSSGLLATPAGARDLYIKNSQGTYDLMALATRHKVSCFVFLSSNLQDRRQIILKEDMPASPSDDYLLSKFVGEIIAEMLNRTTQTRFCSLRISAPYGARFTSKAVIPIFVTRALAGEPLELVGTGQREQVFTYVSDIARACMMAVGTDSSGIYNIAGPRPVSMIDLAHAVLRAAGTKSGVRFSERPDPNEGAKRQIPLDRAKDQLGWEPIYDLDRGLAEMIAELRDPPKPFLIPIQAVSSSASLGRRHQMNS